VRGRKDFRRRLNVAVDDRTSFSSVGRRFHARGAATENAQSPIRCSVKKGCRCWRRAVNSVMECWWPAWAGWWCSPAPDQSGPCARGLAFSVALLAGARATWDAMVFGKTARWCAAPSSAKMTAKRAELFLLEWVVCLSAHAITLLHPYMHSTVH